MYIGIDISTSIVGLAALTDDGEIMVIAHRDLRKVKGNLIVKGLALKGSLTDFIGSCLEGSVSEHGRVTICIEDKLSGFSRGKTTQKTLLMLAGFNAQVSWMAHEIAGQFRESLGDAGIIEIVFIHPSSAKSLVGLKVPKGESKKVHALKLASSVPGFPMHFKKVTKRAIKQTKMTTHQLVPQDYCYDMADAYIVALAGLRRSQKVIKAPRTKR